MESKSKQKGTLTKIKPEGKRRQEKTSAGGSEKVNPTEQVGRTGLFTKEQRPVMWGAAEDWSLLDYYLCPGFVPLEEYSWLET